MVGKLADIHSTVMAVLLLGRSLVPQTSKLKVELGAPPVEMFLDQESVHRSGDEVTQTSCQQAIVVGHCSIPHVDCNQSPMERSFVGDGNKDNVGGNNIHVFL